MGMADENVDSWRCGRVAEKRQTELTDTRAAIEDKQVAVVTPKLDARSVTPVSCGPRARGRYRSTRSPELNKHECPFSTFDLVVDSLSH